ncbi:MAG: autotransporter domain-containing protein [Polaromonas sp.]|uniref:autotransporter domain-containing protein n=1 Tax=Polaromonas sp. TaxID=1869339 RepID=UPI0024897E70|nr:autotransporter domain-containing protein [Polaromonas sp.]MDI1238050.1 autotransporter domain-containing protein [Polaromonas sp.]
MKTYLLTPLALATLTLVHPAAHAHSELRSFGRGSNIYAISADGSTVGGRTDSPDDLSLASTGMAGASMAPLSGLDTERGSVLGLSADGRVAVGAALISNQWRAFRWTSAGLVNLGTLGVGGTSEARAVSGDGNVVVGEAVLSSGAKRAVLWAQDNTIRNLAAGLPAGDSSAAGVSHDGSVVVGVKTRGTVTHAFRWTAAGGMVDLGSLLGGPNADPYSEASGVSADGGVVVGVSQASSSLPGTARHAFHWTPSEGMKDIGTLGGRDSEARAVSANGLVVVGRAENAARISQAFRWTEATGMQSVAGWLADAGVDSSRWNLEEATATNADGSIVVGNGSRNSIETGWLARVSPLGSGVMQPANYSQSLQAVNPSLQHAQSLTRMGMILWGSHHRPLLSYGALEGQNCFWATGDLGRYSAGRDSDESLAEVGLCRDFAHGALRAGVGIGYGRQNQSLGEFGGNRIGGEHVMAELDYQVPTGPQLSATAVRGNWRADVNRGYAGGSGTDFSRGSTAVRSTALRLRADWNDLWKAGAVALSPYVALTRTHTEIAGYTEVGGGFPARFEGQSHTALESRLGLGSTFAIDSVTSLRGTLELAHRFDGQGPAIKGQVLGLFSFEGAGSQIRRSWARAGIDVDRQLTQKVRLIFSLHAASRGEDPSVSAAISLRAAF